jgi:hypothetical protein
MRCLLSVAGFGASFAVFSVHEAPVPHEQQGLAIDVSTATRDDAGDAQCPATVSNSSSVEGGKVLLSIMVPFPEELADENCCQLAGYTLLWTNVKYRPSQKYPDQFEYICTVYDGGEIVAGNETTTAAKMPQPPPVDYHCAERATIDECIVPKSGPASQCAWHEDACHDEPPIECGTGAESEKPFCLNIILADHALPGGPAGRQLGAFNWTDGFVTAGEPIVVQPTQVLELSGSNWWSVGSGYAKNSTGGWEPHPFQVCVRYNELLQDGTSDDDSWFTACATGPGLLDFSRGASSKIESNVYFGEGANNFWGTWVFWSNETAGSALQV